MTTSNESTEAASIGPRPGGPGWGASLRRAHGRPEAGERAAKSKTVALVLAVLFAFWTWLYTYKVDAGKFWAGLALTVAGILLTIGYVGFPILLAVWLWAVFDTAWRSGSWFRAYPNVKMP